MPSANPRRPMLGLVFCAMLGTWFGLHLHVPLTWLLTAALAVGSLLIGFGLMGYVVHHWIVELALISMLAAVAMGGGAGGGMWLTLKKMRSVEGGSQARVATLVGHEATVSVMIPASGYGEIIYVANRQQFNTPARSGTGTEIPKGSKVIIGGFDDEGTFLVDGFPGE